MALLRTFIVRRDNPAHLKVIEYAAHYLYDQASHGQDYAVEVKEITRSLSQNARQWAMLADICGQVGWRRAVWRGDRCVQDGAYVNFSECPQARKLTSEEFKDVFTAAIRKPNMLGSLDGGGIVAVGLRTSKMSVREMSELQELMSAFGAERGVEWSEPPPREGDWR